MLPTTILGWVLGIGGIVLIFWVITYWLQASNSAAETARNEKYNPYITFGKYINTTKTQKQGRQEAYEALTAHPDDNPLKTDSKAVSSDFKR